MIYEGNLTFLKLLLGELGGPTREEKGAKQFDEGSWYLELFINGDINDLDEKWEGEQDPVCIGHIRYDETIFLGIRSSYHSVDSWNLHKTFQLSDVKREEWNDLLEVKCEKYGIEWSEPIVFPNSAAHTRR